MSIFTRLDDASWHHLDCKITEELFNGLDARIDKMRAGEGLQLTALVSQHMMAGMITMHGMQAMKNKKDGFK